MKGGNCKHFRSLQNYDEDSQLINPPIRNPHSPPKAALHTFFPDIKIALAIGLDQLIMVMQRAK
jgi:hypothetical protein